MGDNFGGEVKIRHQGAEVQGEGKMDEDDMEVLGEGKMDEDDEEIAADPEGNTKAQVEDAFMSINHVTMSDFWGTWALNTKEDQDWTKCEKKMKTVLSGYNQVLKDYSVSLEVNAEGTRKIDRLAMVPGLIVDFTGRRERDSRNWDFNDPEMASE